MMKIGWIEEVKALLEFYSPSLSPLNGLGYKQIIAYLNGEINYAQMVAEIQQKTRNFAKRQLTWFRQEKSLKWFEIDKREQVFQATEAFSFIVSLTLLHQKRTNSRILIFSGWDSST